MAEKWPEKITIKVVINSDSQGIKDAMCFVEVEMTTKNDFTLGPFLTDSNGEFVIDEAMIASKLHELVEDFPMDYADSPEYSSGSIVITVESRESVLNRISAIKKYYPSSAMKLQNAYKDAQHFPSKQVAKRAKLTDRRVEISI